MKLPAAVLAFLVLTPAAGIARDDGARLYDTYCSSCHGVRAEGTDVAPPLAGKSAADVHFMIDSGRMPAPVPGVNEIPRVPRFTYAQIDRIVAYVMTLSTRRANASLPIVQPGDLKRGG